VGKHNEDIANVPHDLYPTPAWVTHALLEHIDVAGKRVWEFAAGTGAMAEVLKAAGADVYCTDIERREYPLDGQLDFLSDSDPRQLSFGWGLSLPLFDWQISNPPYGYRGRLITPFIKTGLRRLGPKGGLALLLPIDCDAAKQRVPYFGDCPAFDFKIILNKRVVWFERTDGGREGPKENHAWFIWRRDRQPARARIVYEPNTKIRESTLVKTAA
jgi:hypothetical protein